MLYNGLRTVILKIVDPPAEIYKFMIVFTTATDGMLPSTRSFTSIFAKEIDLRHFDIIYSCIVTKLFIYKSI